MTDHPSKETDQNSFTIKWRENPKRGTVTRDPTGQTIFRHIPCRGMRRVRSDDECSSHLSKKVKDGGLISSFGDEWCTEGINTIEKEEYCSFYISEDLTTDAYKDIRKAFLFHQLFGSESTDHANDENGFEVESKETNAKTLVLPEGLKWGKCGMRSSSTRKRRILRNRVKRLGDHLENVKRTEEEMDVQVMLRSMDPRKVPDLEKPHVSCKPNLTMKSFSQLYVAPYIEAQEEEIELYVLKDLNVAPDPSTVKMQIVNKEDNVGGLRMYDINNGIVFLAYRKIA